LPVEVAVATLLHPVVRLVVGSDISRCEIRFAPLGAGAASILVVLASRSARLANQVRKLAIDYLLYRFVLFVQQDFDPIPGLRAAALPDGAIDEVELAVRILHPSMNRSRFRAIWRWSRSAGANRISPGRERCRSSWVAKPLRPDSGAGLGCETD